MWKFIPFIVAVMVIAPPNGCLAQGVRAAEQAVAEARSEIKRIDAEAARTGREAEAEMAKTRRWEEDVEAARSEVAACDAEITRLHEELNHHFTDCQYLQDVKAGRGSAVDRRRHDEEIRNLESRIEAARGRRASPANRLLALQARGRPQALAQTNLQRLEDRRQDWLERLASREGDLRRANADSEKRQERVTALESELIRLQAELRNQQEIAASLPSGSDSGQRARARIVELNSEISRKQLLLTLARTQLGGLD